LLEISVLILRQPQKLNIEKIYCCKLDDIWINIEVPFENNFFMKIIIIGDSHGHIENLKHVVGLEKKLGLGELSM